MFKYLGETFEPFYREFAEMYDPNTEVGKRRIEQIKGVLQKYSPVKSGRVLDIGCNAGVSTFALEELGFEVVGIDIDGKAIEKARENAKLRNSKAQFYVMDAKRLEFDDESFDLVVTLGYNLPHFSIYDFDEIVREAYRVLKPDGAIIVDYSDFVKALSAGIIKDVYVEEPFIAYHKGFDFKEGSRELFYVNLGEGYTFTMKTYLWSQWIVEFILRKAGFKVRTYPLTSMSVITIGEKKWSDNDDL